MIRDEAWCDLLESFGYEALTLAGEATEYASKLVVRAVEPTGEPVLIRKIGDVHESPRGPRVSAETIQAAMKLWLASLSREERASFQEKIAAFEARHQDRLQAAGDLTLMLLHANRVAERAL